SPFSLSMNATRMARSQPTQRPMRIGCGRRPEVIQCQTVRRVMPKELANWLGDIYGCSGSPTSVGAMLGSDVDRVISEPRMENGSHLPGVRLPPHPARPSRLDLPRIVD